MYWLEFKLITYSLELLFFYLNTLMKNIVTYVSQLLLVELTLFQVDL